MTYSEDQVKEMVRRVLLRTLGPDGVAGAAGDASARTQKPTVTEADLLGVAVGGTLQVPQGAIITPLARDLALERSITLARDGDTLAQETSGGTRSAGSRTVALGADHGGFVMKEDLKAYVEELGYAVTDCGTHNAESVDYPDIAYAVARLVADGSAWRGIIVDGAGIGSCMAANKVPGVRAAMCYDHATANNSREHNDANVLTLGGMLLGSNLARQIVNAWLSTDFGGGRHGRRVDKIVAIEKRYQR